MADNRNQPRNMIPHSGGFFQELTSRFRLIGRLMMDTRVSPLVKLLPVASLVYAVWPIDVPGPIDDAVVLWLGTTLFVELCPPDVVDEHLQAIQAKFTGDQWKGGVPPTSQSSAAHDNVARDDVIDGEYYEHAPNQKQNNP